MTIREIVVNLVRIAASLPADGPEYRSAIAASAVLLTVSDDPRYSGLEWGLELALESLPATDE